MNGGIRIQRFRNISYVKDKKGRVLSFRSRYACCFIITLKGKLKFTFGDKVILTDPSGGIFIPQGTAYTNECLEDAESISVNFYVSEPCPSPCPLCAMDEALAMNFYREISQRAYDGTESAEYDLLSKLYRLAFLLFPTAKAKSTKELFGEKALSYMQGHFHRADLQIDEVAAFCGVSAVYLRKVIKELYQKTPFRLLTELRMKRACEMLSEKRPIKEIALSVGYSDVYQFSRAYKHYFGHAPTAGSLI